MAWVGCVYVVGVLMSPGMHSMAAAGGRGHKIVVLPAIIFPL